MRRVLGVLSRITVGMAICFWVEQYCWHFLWQRYYMLRPDLDDGSAFLPLLVVATGGMLVAVRWGRSDGEGHGCSGGAAALWFAAAAAIMVGGFVVDSIFFVSLRK